MLPLVEIRISFFYPSISRVMSDVEPETGQNVDPDEKEKYESHKLKNIFHQLGTDFLESDCDFVEQELGLRDKSTELEESEQFEKVYLYYLLPSDKTR